jgi:DNA-binding response OmpR family regulator
MAKKILLIDDEQDFVKMLQTRLEASGFAVITAPDGVIGLQQWEQEKPDLIILDITMPNMDGYTFICESKQNKNLKKIPIIILTAREGMKDLFMWEGVQDYFVKPIDDRKLLAKISDLLR